jgi:putative membrane protein
MKNNKSYKGWLAISAVVVLCSTATVQAETQTSAPQGGNTPQTVKSDKLSPGDEKALKDMAQANINEIAAAKIALNLCTEDGRRSWQCPDKSSGGC